MPTILEQQQRLEMEVLATTGYVAILRSHLHQIKDEIATEVKGIQAAYEGRLESAGGKADALRLGSAAVHGNDRRGVTVTARLSPTEGGQNR